MVSLTYLPQKREFKVFIFVLDKTEMTQNDFLFQKLHTTVVEDQIWEMTWTK